MGDKIMIPYEDFKELMEQKGRVKALLAYLDGNGGRFPDRETIIAILGEEEKTVHVSPVGGELCGAE